MTIPALPAATRYGTQAGDIGQAASTFAEGMLGQRQRLAQLALQQALGQANVQHLGAETGLEQAQTGEAGVRTGLLGEQAQAAAHGLEPAGHDQYLQLRHFMPDATEDEMSGMNRTEADTYIQRTAQAWAMKQMQLELARSRMSDTEESRLRMSYDRDSTHSIKLLDNYRGALQQYSQAAKTNPYQAEGMLLSWLRQNTNRMNQAEISRISSLGGLDALWQRHVQGQIIGSNPLGQQQLGWLRDAASGVGQSIYQEYQGNRNRYTQLSQTRGIDPSFVVGPDNYSDIPGLETEAGVRPGPAPTAPTLQDLHGKMGY